MAPSPPSPSSPVSSAQIFRPGIILILGLANLVADGFSMAASNYAGTKHEKDDQERTRIWEERQIDREPEGEAEEMRQIYRSKGFEGEDLDRAVEVITSNRDEWVKTMMIEEYGMPHIVREPIKSGLATFVAFGLCGAVPLAPYFVFAPERAFHDLAGTHRDRLSL